MRFFSKKEPEELISESSKHADKEESIPEIQNTQNEIRTKQKELDNITQKIQTVKEEYNNAISNLMLVKKELNQKKMELDLVKLEYKKISEKNKKPTQIKDPKSISEFNKTEEKFLKMKEDLEKITNEYEEAKKQTVQAQYTLHNIKKQQVEYEKELDETRSRLYNAKEELGKKDDFQDTDVLTSKEREFIQGSSSNQKEDTGVIEAASIVVGSLKSKLNMTQKELEAVQLLLEKERDEHERTRLELEKMKKAVKLSKQS